jgi:16S rRNA (cytosine1402-N4)-methyltransferase
MKYGSHYSVMKKDILDVLSRNFSDQESLVFADLTFGAGGHTRAIAESFKGSSLYSFDQDPDAISNGKSFLDEHGLGDQVKLIDSNFNNFSNMLAEEIHFDGVLLDAGVSSHQFDTGERGFSFRFDGPLDMRMNPNAGVPAADLLNGMSEEDLRGIFQSYGEEKFSRQIAKSIVERREVEPFTTTKQLEDTCFHAYPKKLRHGKIHPATKVFQALRIKVNDELGVLGDVISQVIPRLKVNGLLMIITFHSLEDRIVKHAFKEWTNESFPIEILTKKPLLPSAEEIFENSRSRSAKLRVIRRVKDWPSKNKYPKKE